MSSINNYMRFGLVIKIGEHLNNFKSEPLIPKILKLTNTVKNNFVKTFEKYFLPKKISNCGKIRNDRNSNQLGKLR